ncbi:transposase [Bacillus sp. FJAT-49732]|uniref:Transposase n=1 Tax=Lederbergia citrisecunda TaxID=2833583 RepID=A0A942YJ63_9BACI|nr:transposase [Lederbergia citrisecunda]MBS4198302.1 transposase [Lederbergia citrisecunda]
MTAEELVKKLYQTIIKENLVSYQELFNNNEMKDVTDSYWKEALKFFEELTEDNKKILFKIIEQVQVDAISTILGIIDGVVTIPGEQVEIEMKITGDKEPINGDLQDLFLAYDEENR